MNLFSILEDAAQKWPEDAAVIHGGRSFSYAELHRAAESLALELRQAGVRAGDKVGVVFPNSPEMIIAVFAVLRADGIVIAISPGSTAAEVANLTEELEVNAFCSGDQFKSRMPGGGRHRSEAAILKGRRSFWIQRAAGPAAAQGERDRLLKTGAAVIRFTSGSTSKAKGVMVSHAALLQCGRAYAQTYSIVQGETVLCLLSMAHAMGMPLACLLQGAAIVMVNALEEEALPRLVREYPDATVYGMPMFYRMALNMQAVTAGDCRAVKYFISTAIALPRGVSEAFREKFGREILQHYGVVECCGPIMANLNEDKSKRGSVGKISQGYEIKLLAGDAEASGAGIVGEMYVRGPSLFEGYYKPWRLRDEEWFKTGDVARCDADGYYWIVGRTKEVINVGGVKVFPYEIEEALLNHPAVEEALVYGAPEPLFGEAPHAKVKLVPGMSCTEKELLQQVNRQLSVFKALRGLTFVDEIPKTVTGKPRRLGMT